MNIYDGLMIGLESSKLPKPQVMAEGHSDVEAEFANADMALMMQELEESVNEMDIVLKASDTYCESLEFVSKLKLETATEKLLANALLMGTGHIVDSKEEINGLFEGLESGADVGLERRYVRKIRDTVKKVIDWFIAQYQRIKKIVVDFFQKYFGSIERLQKQVLAIKTKAGEMSEYTIDAKTVDIGDFVQPFYRRGQQVTAVSTLVEGIDDYTKVVGAYNKGVVVGLDKVIQEFVKGVKEIDFDAEKIDVTKIKTDLMERHDTMQTKAFTGLLKPYTISADPRFPNQTVQYTKNGLLGNRDLFLTSSATQADTATLAGRAAAINASDIRLMNYKWEKKQRDKTSEKSGKFNTLTTQEIGNLLGSVETCLDEVYQLARGDERVGSLTNLDEAFSQYEKLKTSLSGDDFTPELRQTLQFVGNQLTKFRRQLMDVPLNFCNDTRTVCAAMARLSSASLSNHKKPDQA